MSEDNELEKLKAKRLAEMQKNLSSKQKPKKVTLTPRETVVTKLGFRGLEVLENAEYQFPRETQMVVLKLAELYLPIKFRRCWTAGIFWHYSGVSVSV
jgi:hypothetical protein